ncbi:hypothetical protein AURDEDRAFT_131017 [Auricularia subglabra TFB-10046 SS5]|nr:hypothetical protein AURDEDRAFT_131017 [Auricularia subglabra TFB-10046 SS5]
MAAQHTTLRGSLRPSFRRQAHAPYSSWETDPAHALSHEKLPGTQHYQTAQKRIMPITFRGQAGRRSLARTETPRAVSGRASLRMLWGSSATTRFTRPEITGNGTCGEFPIAVTGQLEETDTGRYADQQQYPYTEMGTGAIVACQDPVPAGKQLPTRSPSINGRRRRIRIAESAREEREREWRVEAEQNAARDDARRKPRGGEWSLRKRRPLGLVQP